MRKVLDGRKMCIIMGMALLGCSVSMPSKPTLEKDGVALLRLCAISRDVVVKDSVARRVCQFNGDVLPVYVSTKIGCAFRNIELQDLEGVPDFLRADAKQGHDCPGKDSLFGERCTEYVRLSLEGLSTTESRKHILVFDGIDSLLSNRYYIVAAIVYNNGNEYQIATSVAEGAAYLILIDRCGNIAKVFSGQIKR